MSSQNSRSSNPRDSNRKRFHGLKMETLPFSADLKNNETFETVQDIESEKMADYETASTHSKLEHDDDFKFKRHRSKQAGTASLGERLDNIQELQKARWMDNFNSSVNFERQTLNQNYSRKVSPSQNQSQQPPIIADAPQPMAPPYMPYMYYYPMTQLMPMPTSPVRPPENSSQLYINTSTQPFMPPIPHGNGQLMPPPPLYPNYPAYNFQNNVDHRRPNRRDRKRSFMAQRGRRLSMLSFQDDHSHIISPHKDVPERDFYRHIANTSFGHELQVRQLFNWCFIRSLRKWEKSESTQQRDAGQSGETYTDPKRIAMVVIKEFVEDLRRGKIGVDWEAEEYNVVEEDDEKDSYRDEDTELRELFDHDEDESVVVRMPTKRRRRELPNIPNEKNVENAKNLVILEKQINDLREEIKIWSEMTNEDNSIARKWTDFKTDLASKAQRANDSDPYSTVLSEQLGQLNEKLETRMDNFQNMAHFLNSHSKLISQTSQKRLEKLTACLRDAGLGAGPEIGRRKEVRNLLQGLSKILTEQ
ncbi:LAMI_0B04896g1_1 [Lachancea mirantina]|uniref:LAMI_0B04896g1_1 n=1 Tax=Lachancea mirantina TaxID=1230905 RepID=A0A1G4IVN5_9SACH|nr:LAMI_0B04896g1_1 [Lachancea mirantina]